MIDELLEFVPENKEVSAAIDNLQLPVNDLGFDQWGLSPEHCRKTFTLGHYIYRYFRPEINGIEHVPPGRVLLVGNHSGVLPLDGLVVCVSCLIKANPPRIIRPMADYWFPTLPVIGELFARSGVALGDRSNCRNLLEADNAILIFPEGRHGAGKGWQKRYQVQSFGNGFMRLALECKTPIVPFAVVGAEESIINIYNIDWLGKLLGMPFFPVHPLTPVLGLASYLPWPTKFHVYFGEPMEFRGSFDDEDDIVDQKVNQVREKIQSMINAGLSKRKSWFF